jgi:hypothetical protein
MRTPRVGAATPSPRSGEFGALFVAAHFEELTGVAPQRVMMVHDSTVLLRALTADELARAEHAVWPLWNTPRGFVNLDSAETLITDVIVPASLLTSSCRQWMRSALQSGALPLVRLMQQSRSAAWSLGPLVHFATRGTPA